MYLLHNSTTKNEFLLKVQNFFATTQVLRKDLQLAASPALNGPHSSTVAGRLPDAEGSAVSAGRAFWLACKPAKKPGGTPQQQELMHGHAGNADSPKN